MTTNAPELQRLRRLALRHRIRADSTIRPFADAQYDLRSRHGLQLTMAQAIALPSAKVAP